MAADPEFLTPAEAAMVADVDVRDVHRMIDEEILPEELYTVSGGRQLRSTACPFMGFYVHEAKKLTKEERDVVIGRVCSRIGATRTRLSIRGCRRASKRREWTVQDGNLTVSLWDFVTRADERQAKLAQARAMVVEDPDILGGAPVIKGTRIPVHDVAASIAAGLPASRIKTAYPGLNDRKLELAQLYAEAVPLRGRPKQTAPLPAAISTRKVVRRGRA
ncbi:MAG: DUF433 domain-containing protein [Rhizomicrobium sp.]|jgi:uncharacterized protein (DUF433 family)